MVVTNPSIERRGTGNFASSSSTTLVLYNGVESISKDAGFIEFPLPKNDADKKIVMDLLGASRSISISGTVTSSDVANLRDYARDLVGLDSDNALINADQKGNGASAGYIYTSEVLNRGLASANYFINVYVSRVDVNPSEGNTDSFDYSIELIEIDNETSV